MIGSGIGGLGGHRRHGVLLKEKGRGGCRHSSFPAG